MIVYRVENRLHEGPYNASVNQIRPRDFYYWSVLHEGANAPPPDWPAPWEDVDGWPKPDQLSSLLGISTTSPEFKRYVFGFQTREQVRWWFGRFADLLEQHNYLVGRYQVSSYTMLSGRHQIAFERTAAKFLDHVSFKDFLSTVVDEKIEA